MCFRPPTAQKRENKCPECGTINLSTAAECVNCGAELKQGPPPPGQSGGVGPKMPPPPGRPGGAPPAPPKAPPSPPKAPPKKDN
jgi:hypothetical protein